MWLQESCPRSEVTPVTCFAFRDRCFDGDRQSHHGSMTMFRMHPQIGDLESVTVDRDVRIRDNLVQTWKVWTKEEKQLHLALEWSMIGARSELERRWRYQGSQMITKSMTRLWRSIRIRRAVCAQCKTWSSLWRTFDWRCEFQWSSHSSRQVSIMQSREWRWPSSGKSFRKWVMVGLRRQASSFKNPACPSRCGMETKLVFEENYSKWFVREVVTSFKSESHMSCWNTCTRT